MTDQQPDQPVTHEAVRDCVLNGYRGEATVYDVAAALRISVDDARRYLDDLVGRGWAFQTNIRAGQPRSVQMVGYAVLATTRGESW